MLNWRTKNKKLRSDLGNGKVGALFQIFDLGVHAETVNCRWDGALNQERSNSTVGMVVSATDHVVVMLHLKSSGCKDSLQVEIEGERSIYKVSFYMNNNVCIPIPHTKQTHPHTLLPSISSLNTIPHRIIHLQ